MAKNAYIGVGNISHKVKQPYVSVSGVARKVKNGYIGVAGVARHFYQTGTPLNALPVGSSVYMNVNGIKTEFLIVHQGLPSGEYDSSCSGTWILMKDIYSKKAWGVETSSIQFADPTLAVRKYLDNTFAPMLDQTIYNLVKTVKIPVMTHRNGKRSILGTANLKLFLLSTDELGISQINNTKYPSLDEGTTLSYFSDGTTSKRIANYNGSVSSYWTRTMSRSLKDGYEAVHHITTGGYVGTYRNYVEDGIRPAMIFPNTVLVND